MSGVVTGAISLGIGAVSTGFSFIQAGIARNRSDEAQAEADRKMADARGRTDVNFYENLAVQQETYNRAYREQQVAAKANLQAMQEQGVRGVAGVGMLQQATQDAMSSVRAAQEKELVDRQRLITEEDSRLRDVNIQLDLGEVEGAQLAAASEANAANYATQQGIQGLVDIGLGVAEAQTLFGGPRDGMTDKAKAEMDALDNKQKNANLNQKKKVAPKVDATGKDVPDTSQGPAGLNPVDKELEVANINTDNKVKAQATTKLSDADLYKDLKAYDSPEKIKKLQGELIQRGFPLPKFGQDGKVGDETTKAYFKYRRRFE